MIGFLIMLAMALGLFAALVLGWYGSESWRRDRQIRNRKRQRRHRHRH